MFSHRFCCTEMAQFLKRNAIFFDFSHLMTCPIAAFLNNMLFKTRQFQSRLTSLCQITKWTIFTWKTKQKITNFEPKTLYRFSYSHWENAKRIPTSFATRVANLHRKITENRHLTFTRKLISFTSTSNLVTRTNHRPRILFARYA